MNGRALPLASREIEALSVVHAMAVGRCSQDGTKLQGAGTLSVKEPDRAANLDHGKEVFGRVCAACHGADGLGKRAASGAGYEFPPLWGPDSYNNGAGMTRLLDAAGFPSKTTCPFGTTYAAPVLSDEEAYDVSGFYRQRRAAAEGRSGQGLPHPAAKAVNSPYGPYADDFSPEQHKYGPFTPIRAKVKELKEQSTRVGH